MPTYCRNRRAVQEGCLVRQEPCHLVALGGPSQNQHKHGVSVRSGAVASRCASSTHGFQQDILREGVEHPARALEACVCPGWTRTCHAMRQARERECRRGQREREGRQREREGAQREGRQREREGRQRERERTQREGRQGASARQRIASAREGSAREGKAREGSTSKAENARRFDALETSPSSLKKRTRFQQKRADSKRSLSKRPSLTESERERAHRRQVQPPSLSLSLLTPVAHRDRDRSSSTSKDPSSSSPPCSTPFLPLRALHTQRERKKERALRRGECP